MAMCRDVSVLDRRRGNGLTWSMRTRAAASAWLFVGGLLVAAGGFAALLNGGQGQCAFSSSGIAHALSAPCGGVSMLAGLLMLTVAGFAFWTSARLNRGRR